MCSNDGVTYDDPCVFICDKMYVDRSLEPKSIGKCSDEKKILLPDYIRKRKFEEYEYEN